MSALFAAAAEIQSYLRGASERFCFIGGIALQRWGEPRFTRDIDLTLLCPFGVEEQAVDRLLAGFAGRIADARAFAIQQRVVREWLHVSPPSLERAATYSSLTPARFTTSAQRSASFLM